MLITTLFDVTDEYADRLVLTHGDEYDTFVFGIGKPGDDIEDFDRPATLPCVGLTRAEVTELHAALTEALGLTHPRPTSPLTASKAHDPYLVDEVTTPSGKRIR